MSLLGDLQIAQKKVIPLRENKYNKLCDKDLVFMTLFLQRFLRF